MTTLRPTTALLTPAVAKTIKELGIEPGDAAAIVLALRYAKAIDAAEDDAEALEKLGPKLLACLAELGATPKARAAVLRGGASGGGKLAALRSARAG